ncbi:MAG: magnesium transporter CorA family protein [Saprospiraceae bacterium]|jgi:magnesium transporter
MVRYYAKKGGKLLELEQPEHGCWVNITPPYNTEELEEAAQYFEVPLDFITDSLDVDERSRYEVEDDARLILVNTPVPNEKKGEDDAIYITVPIGIIMAADAVITVTSSRDNPVLQRFLEDKIKNFDPADETLFILQILEQNVYRFLTYLKKLDLKRNLIEQELYHSSKNRELKQLLSIEKSLVYFVNSLNANDLLKLKIKRTDFLSIRDDEEKTDLFEDIIIDNGQALDMANVYSNILSGTMDTYASIISNNMNVTIHRLTLVTIFIAVPTLITSFFGMNVPLPFSGSRFAILFIFVFSSVISLLIAWYFQRKRLF